MKRSLLLLVFLSLLAISSICFAEEVEVSVAVNSSFVQDVFSHYLIDGQIYVAARVTAEAVGGVVTWKPETRELYIQYQEKLYRLQVGKTIAYGSILEAPPLETSSMGLPDIEKKNAATTQETTENNTQPSTEAATETTTEALQGAPSTDLTTNPLTEIPLIKAPFIKNGITYVPVQFIADSFGLESKWFERTFTLVLLKKDYEVPQALRYARPYTDVDLLWLARIIQAESPSGSLRKKMAVANVVLNRVESPRFPNAIRDVIFSPNQFPPTTRTAFLTLEPSLESMIAAKRALEGNNPIGACLFFNNRPFAGKKADFYEKIEGDFFYK